MDINIAKGKFSSKASKIMLMTVLCTGLIFCTMTFTVIAPFYPIVALEYGLTQAEVGLVFSVFHLANIIIGPFIGLLISKIGLRFLFLSCLFICSVATFCFAFTIKMNTVGQFYWFAVTIRIFQGVSAIGLQISSLTVATNTFPDDVSKFVGLLEIANGIGYAIAPFLGGLLYEVGGYMVPFIALSTANFLTFFISVMFTKTSEVERNDVHDITQKRPTAEILTTTNVWISCLILFLYTASYTFFDIGLSQFVNSEFHKGSFETGIMFAVNSLTYAISGTMIGYIGDKTKKLFEILLFGIFLHIFSLLFLGPAYFLHLKTSIWASTFAIGLAGFAYAAMYIPTMDFILCGIREKGIHENVAVTGFISCLLMTSCAFGGFVSPLIGGQLLEMYDFREVCTIYALVNGIVVILLVFYFVFVKCKRVKRNDVAAFSPLVRTEDTKSKRNYDTL
ncbi:Uncharacterised protein g6202 [Pycnogonum litorale]